MLDPMLMMTMTMYSMVNERLEYTAMDADVKPRTKMRPRKLMRD